METGNIIIGIVSFLAVISPFIIMYQKSKKKEKELLKKLKEYAANHDFQIDQWEATGNLMLGLDEVNKVGFCIELIDGKFEIDHVLLNELSFCKVDREKRTVSYHNHPEKVTQSLKLYFYPKQKSDETKYFRLYDEEATKQLNGEIELSEVWESKFRALI
ncbi:hypothetical protein [Brumimicrobium aurantiacum]|uniref:Uncharacterized protein n=1 Tax=Brumimicrobium aurantiacum TaxID=1737063 RepID=A0A3E1EYI1_9FLAO|nr:hypothetical protein [Brumimicrobium aurantiacum]RFC54604.1 hypothetical protein DXU93_06340 [Brumimicrobium aurantiacum]